MGGGEVGHLRYPVFAFRQTDRARGDLSRPAGSSLRCDSSCGRRRLMMSLMRSSLQGRRNGPQHVNPLLRHLTDMSRNPSPKSRNSVFFFVSPFSDAPPTRDPINRRHTPPPLPAASTVDFSAERNTITASAEIRHVDLSCSSPNEIFPTFPFRAGG